MNLYFNIRFQLCDLINFMNANMVNNCSNVIGFYREKKETYFELKM